MSLNGLCKKVVFFSLLVALTASVSLFAQTTGTILGTLKDQSGAVLPGANVTVTNSETGLTRTTISGARGEYRIPSLAVGTYHVSATMAGFQTGIRQGITLTIGREAVVDFSLQVGNVAEQVTVTGEAPLIETTTATVGGVVDSQQIRDIPLNARSFLELIPALGNAVFTEMGEQSASKGFGKKLSIAGTRYNASLFLLDGATMNDSTNTAGSAAGTIAGVETVREFKVVTNAFDAEYGRHTGGVVNAVTKSGTNQFHGSVFEFLRNDNVDAAKWEDNKFRGGEKPEFRRNQFGGTLGGPIIRDRTHFFGSYEGLRQALGQTNVYDVPGFGMRAGNLPLSQTTAAACQQGGGTVQGNICNNFGIESRVRPYLFAWPEPNVPCTTDCLGTNTFDRTNGAARYSKHTTQVTDQNYYTGRVDHRISDSDSIFGRFTHDKANRNSPGRSDSFNTLEFLSSPNYFSTMEETHIFSPTLLGKTHFSYNRTNLTIADLELPGFNYPIFSFDGSDVPGRIGVSNLSGWGGDSTNPKEAILNDFQFKEDFFYSTGRHSFKMGFHFERNQFNQRSDFNSGGTFGFDSLAEFMRNDVASAQFVSPGSDNIRGWRQNLTAFYFQDDINVKPGLTVNLGVRYEFINVPKEVNGKVANIRDLRDEHFYTVRPNETDVGDPYIKNPSLKNFAPRVGVVWDPFGTGRTSIRSGFGLYYDQLMNYTAVGTGGVRAAPFYSVAELFRENFPGVGIDFPNAYTSQVSTGQTGGSRPQIDGFEHFVSQPYMMKWSFDIERQLAGGITVETGYNGNRGIHLLRGNMQLNVTPRTFVNGVSYILLGPNPLLPPNSILPNPHWNRMRWRIADGESDYQAFRVGVSKRFSRGFQFHSSYTVSKATDDSSTWTGSSDFGAADRNGYRNTKDHGLSGYDVRQAWGSSFVVDLPGSNLAGAAGTVLGGWSVSSIVRLNSGHPFTLSAQNPQARVSGVTYSPQFLSGASLDLVPGADQAQVFPQNPDKYYEPANYQLPLCWSAPTSCNPVGYFQGNVGKNHLISPGVANVDITLMKETAIPVLGESGGLQFRWEMFNLFNRPNFGLPGTQVFQRSGIATTGRAEITTTRTSSREMQFALRLVF